MEFRIAADELKKALYRAQGIVERKTTMPILANVLVNATKTGVHRHRVRPRHRHRLRAPRRGDQARRRHPLRQDVFDIVQNLPGRAGHAQEARQQLRRDHQRHARTSRSSAWRAEEYPEAAQGGERARWCKVTGNTLLEMIKKTSFAISTDETRYILNGVFFEPRDGGKVRMVATDGHRLALIERELAGDFKLKSGVIIPRKGLIELKRLLDEAPDAECQLGFAENSALFKKPGLTMVMRLIDGQFPEYQRVIPKEGEKRGAWCPQARFLEGAQAHRAAVARTSRTR